VNRTKAMVVAAAAVVLLVVVAVLALVGVGTQPTATGTPTAVRTDPVVTARDGAVDSAETAAKVLSSADYADPEGTVDRMEQVATGQLLDQIRASRTESIAQIRQSAALTTGEVIMVAASEVYAVDGKVVVLALVKVTTTGRATPKQVRLRLEMTRTPQGWKASAVSSPPAG
jgi:Mce-associated membrane protein